MRHMKKAVSILMAAALVLSLSITAFAAGDVTTINGEGYTITFDKSVELKTETMGDFQGSKGELAGEPVEVYQIPVGTKITLNNSIDHIVWYRQELSGLTQVLQTDGTWDDSGNYSYTDNENGVVTYNEKLVFEKGSTISYSEFMPSEYGVYTLSYYNVDNLMQETTSYKIRVITSNNTGTNTESEITGQPTASTVLVNGTSLSFDAYNINDNNYFKLRDIAMALTGSEKQFEVTWDNTNKVIDLVSGSPYTAVGGEMAAGDGTAKAAILNTSAINKDGVQISLTAYTINGNNYFKLRDLGQTFNFGVTWDSTTNTISIDTSTGYESESSSTGDLAN